MKAKELRERSGEDLAELKKSLSRELFGFRMKNHTSQLGDTSLLGKTRRDLARIEQILLEKAPKAASKGEKS